MNFKKNNLSGSLVQSESPPDYVNNTILHHGNQQNLRGDVKLSMSDKKPNSPSFLFDSPSPFPSKLKRQKVEKFCNVSVKTHDINST